MVNSLEVSIFKMIIIKKEEWGVVDDGKIERAQSV
jgi:hypothetical protein